MRFDLCFTLFYVYIFATAKAEQNNSAFVPTREWQTIKRGTPIPGGLHIRHNLQTGVTEVKLMDNDETGKDDFNVTTNNSQSKSLSLHPDNKLPEDKSVNSEKEHVQLKFSPTELKAKLKKLKAEKAELSSEDKSSEVKVKKKFRDYETLKNELKNVNINVTTDAELLNAFFKKFQMYKNSLVVGILTIQEKENVLDILNNLEYLIHQIDNAQLFADMEGMTKIISPCLNGTYNDVKVEALRLLGAAVQSNPKVQKKALQSDMIEKLLYMLSSNAKLQVKSRCLFALSALIRQYPAAQKTFIDHGGLEIFGSILLDGQMQTQVKVMRLINDLVVERQDLKKIYDSDQHQRNAREYATTDFEQKLFEHRYCEHLRNLMITSFDNKSFYRYDGQNSELIEVICESMITIAPICKNEFREKKEVIIPVINNMIRIYEDLNKDDLTISDHMINDLVQLFKELKTVIVETGYDEL